MSKNKKRKKDTRQPQISGYKKFLIDMQEALKFTRVDILLKDIPDKYKRMMYSYRMLVLNPVAANALISPKELKNIADKTKKYYREPHFADKKGYKYSAYQLMLVYCYTAVRAKMMEKEIGDKNHSQVLKMNNLSSRLLESHYTKFLLHYFRAITQLNNPCHKYFGVDIRLAPVVKINPMLKTVVEVYGIPASKQLMLIDGIARPAYRLGKAMGTELIEWIKADKNSLGNFYRGKKKCLMYISSRMP